MDFVKVRLLNNRLKKTYGVTEDNRPFFRLAWSNAQTETRFGTYTEFCGAIFLREFTGVAKDRKKYPMFKDRWILEKLMFPARAYRYWSPELIGVENGSYEPVWTFEKDNAYQEPEWYPITKLVRLALYGPDKVMTPSEMESEEAKAFDKACQDAYDELDNECSFLVDQMHVGSAIVVPGVIS